MKSYCAGAFAFLPVLLLAGCGSLLGPSNPPPQIYVLKPPLAVLADAPAVSWQLAVSRPEMAQMLDTDRIALVRGAIMDYYADAQWTDASSRLLQGLLIEAFAKSGKILGVGRDTGEVRADYVLQTQVRDFEAQYQGGNGVPTVSIVISAQLTAARTREVVASFEATRDVPAAQNTVPAVVETFDAATSAALEDIARWALRTPPAAGPADAAPRKGS
jgi:cholesterol transport system auxiliary component